MMIREENLRNTAGSRIGAFIVGIAFVVLGLAIKTGALDISMIQEGWSDSSLSVFTVWWSYAFAGALLIITGFWPSSYKSAKLYADKIELTKKETVAYGFDKIFDISVKKRVVMITFKDGSAQVKFTCRKKSDFPYVLNGQFVKWKNSNS